MRKEVKLGMTIGGGLIAVLVVYLLVAPPANNKNGTQLVTGGGGAGNNIIDVSQPGDGQSGGAVADDSSSKSGAKSGTENSAQAAPASTGTPDVQPTHDNTDQPAAPTGKQKDPWKKALVEGKTDKSAPTPAAPTPASPVTPTKPVVVKDKEATKPNTSIKHDVVALGTPAAGTSEPKLYFNPNAAWGDGVSTHDVLGTQSHSAETHAAKTSSHAAPPAATPSGKAAAEGTYVVQSGDTLSSIAAEAYGSASYYPHILRANPTVNPNNLKLGTTLILPKADEVKATAVGSERPTAVASITQDVKIDPKTQYQVQSGDSLYKISLKVYGKTTYVEKIYEKNKAIIGSDPKKLKLGMVLELPEKAALAAASSPEATDTSIENDRR